MRIRGIVSVFAVCLLLASCSKQKPERQVVKLRVYEGYPERIITNVQNRQLQLKGTQSRYSAARFQQIVNVSKTWKPGETITVAFRGGPSSLRQKIAGAVKPWTDAANVTFDFGNASANGVYREWSTSDTDYVANVRISFDAEGYWSLVGREALDRSLAKPNEASMNFEAFDRALPDDWEATVLHEFGHAVGFDHEHQIPQSACQTDFRWDDEPGYVRTPDLSGQFIPDDQNRNPGLYTVLGGPPNNWKREKVDFNLKALAFTKDTRLTPFDRFSIMKYYFDTWMFKTGEHSGCFSPENLTLSEDDKKVAGEVYPRTTPLIRAALDEKIQALQALSQDSSLPQDLRVAFQSNIHSLAMQKAKMK